MELATAEGQHICTQNPIILHFEKNGRVSGVLGCNRANGTYSVDNDHKIKFSNLATTRATYPDQDIENQIIETLNTVSYYNIANGELMLTVGRRAPMATFKPVNHPEIANRHWNLTELNGKKFIKSQNMEQTPYFILKSDLKLSGFAGCNLFGGS